MSRRRFLRAGVTAGSVAALAGVLSSQHATTRAHRTIERAFAADPGSSGSLGDIDHFVFLMQENRSFDHYFGSMSGVRGFDEPSALFHQRGWAMGAGAPSADGVMTPFRLNTEHGDPHDAQILNNPVHGWTVQHASWNHGALDRWLPAHAAADGVSTPILMGFYERADIPVHYALADAFTVCDHYFSSVIGPTSPNRLHWMTATNDPDGIAGGPVSSSLVHHARGSLSWRTFPENLQDAGVSWKVYTPRHPAIDINGTLGYFQQYQDPTSQLHRRGLAPVYPADFLRDVAAGTLPSVSWIIPTKATSEHPAHPSAVAAEGIMTVLDALTANPALWERTALIVSYDENGGFFDHVAPPTAPFGTPGEWMSHDGEFAPVGLGFRVPALVLSPYTRGGLISSTTFDHTSQLQLLATRFGVPVPNLSAWRAATAQNMASVFADGRSADLTVPRVPNPAPAARASLEGDTALLAQASAGHRPPYPVPSSSVFRQATTPVRTRINHSPSAGARRSAQPPARGAGA